MSDPQVLIVGAGPTGLVLALRLARHGIPFHIVAKAAGPGEASRAMVVHARTLEFYAQMGFADEVVAKGIRMERARFHEGTRELAMLSFKDVGTGMSPYPFVLCYPQDDHERFLAERLRGFGAAIEWDTELISLEQDGERVRVVLRRDGREEAVEVPYLCGCDGAHTATRRELGFDFPGGTYDQLFFVADVAIDGPFQTDLHMHLGERSLVLMLPVRSSGMQRLIGVVPPMLSGRNDFGFDDVRPYAEDLLGIRVATVNWFSTYRVHHRVAAHFRSNRVFIAGDAGHLHSPAGGQGMNTGIGDAVNLSWKLAHLVQGRISPDILDTFEAERIVFARKLVETTDRAFQGMVGEGWTSRVLRDWIMPHLMPVATHLPAVRRALFATLSQTRIAYRDSAISEGKVGGVSGGDRLPWTGDNYASLDGRDWGLHVYGEPSREVETAAAAHDIVVRAYPWEEAAERSGFKRDALYLVRPDGHVALANAEQDATVLDRFAERWQIGSPSAFEGQGA
ncbi:FAD-dependent monooxygenase [Aureimonas leprariae]|uniref:Monooxygenase n=1 Tax=Plantimonas leprariae TaxID=2615207 RepID=A0A7V7TUI2_9HYPH|nr:FAD-dependent monooxygenase [Aureimonas leprariae]KAB0676082.1 monooxygenase [Aureimonas leprariae]